jgi:hypothetical protein
MNNIGLEASEQYLRAVTLSKIRMGQLFNLHDIPSGLPSRQPRVRVPLVDALLPSVNELTRVEVPLEDNFLLNEPSDGVSGGT